MVFARGITEMSRLKKWTNAALLVADFEDMEDDEVIPTWPADCVKSFPDMFPQLTVGALREWQASVSAWETSSTKTLIAMVLDLCGYPEDHRHLNQSELDDLWELALLAEEENKLLPPKQDQDPLN
jgi:hypothetical protein